jgi:hypothetical protein
MGARRRCVSVVDEVGKFPEMDQVREVMRRLVGCEVTNVGKTRELLDVNEIWGLLCVREVPSMPHVDEAQSGG